LGFPVAGRVGVWRGSCGAVAVLTVDGIRCGCRGSASSSGRRILGLLLAGRGVGWRNRAGDAGGAIGIDGGEGTEEETADVSKDRGTAGRDEIVGEEAVEVLEGVVYALGGLEGMGVVEEGDLQVEGVGVLVLDFVVVAKVFAGTVNRQLATAA